MTRKPASLAAGLVAVKGAAAPAPDMPGRGAPPTPVAPTPAPKSPPDTAGAPLNFRVSAAFRREFKVYAASHGLKLNELLRRSFAAYRRANGD